MAGSPENTEQPFDRELGQRDETVRLLAQGQKVFKRYTLVRVVGRGGMGVVWLARDEELDRNVALKFLPESICHDKEASAELKRETRRSLELTHPNIVRIYDFVHDEERAAIAMEYIDGKTLSALKVEQPAQCFEVHQIAGWVQQLCAALDYAHNVARVVHQDLKPANLMIDAKGKLKITDFGIARSIADSVTRITAEDTVGGTLVYMSPQQLNGEKASPANDIYSLGATLYDLLSGKPPFYTGLLHQQIERKSPVTMTARRADLNISGDPIPEAWEQCIATCLAKSPAERPTRALEVAARLGLPGSDSDFGGIPKPPDQAARSGWSGTRTRTAVLAGVLLLVGALTVPFLARNGKPGADKGSAAAITSAGKGQGAAKKPRKLPPVVIQPLPRMTNSLGMVFVKLDDLYVCIWETRIRDFKAFVDATGHDANAGVMSKGPDEKFAAYGVNWLNPGWEQSPDHPVTGMNQLDAKAFCDWLTERENKAGTLPAGHAYRLPTDREWSVFADFAQETGATPAGRDLRHRDVYPWGGDWPPTGEAGNYSVVDDGFANTSPAGRFRPNRYGIFDLGGNLWEWCEDAFDGTFDPAKPEGTLRGGSYLLKFEDQISLSRRRWANRLINTRIVEFGFRVVRGLRKPPPASLDQLGPRLTNSLGMVFARVGPLYFSVWETRVQDFTAFAGATKHIVKGTLQTASPAGGYAPNPRADWRNPGFPQTPTHPVVGVARADAEAFCDWLTARVRSEGKLPAGFIYRLPTDQEWSRAAGLSRETGETPEERKENGKARDTFPWGNTWPPPPHAGHYRGGEGQAAGTAPAGGSAPNQFGLYDVGGNVWEWCEDGFGRSILSGVLRGASFLDDSRTVLNSSHRRNASLAAADRLDSAVGFRCVLAPEGGGIAPVTP